MRVHFAYATQIIDLISKLEKIQRRAIKFILQLFFIREISYKERLISLDLLPVCYWHELLDMVFFYKATHNLVHLSPFVVPVVRESGRTTRASATSFYTFVPKRCRTTTYQNFFLLEQPEIGTYSVGK